MVARLFYWSLLSFVPAGAFTAVAVVMWIGTAVADNESKWDSSTVVGTYDDDLCRTETSDGKLIVRCLPADHP